MRSRIFNVAGAVAVSLVLSLPLFACGDNGAGSEVATKEALLAELVVFRDSLEEWIATYPEVSALGDGMISDPSATVGDLVEAIRAEAPRLHELLDRIEESADRFAAKSSGVLDSSTVEQWRMNVDVWLSAQRLQTDPANACMDFPTEVLSWPASRMGDYLPMADCLLEIATSPDSPAVLAQAAGERVVELSNQMAKDLE